MEFIGIIIAVVGFLFSYLENEKKKKKQNEKPNQKPSKELNQKSNEKPKKPPIIIDNPFKTLEKTDNTTLENIRSFLGNEEKKQDTSSQEIEDLKRQNERLKKKLKLIEQQRLSYSKVADTSPEASKSNLFTKDNAVEAIVFSEVLSAPRAKSPHYSYRKSMTRKSN